MENQAAGNMTAKALNVEPQGPTVPAATPAAQKKQSVWHFLVSMGNILVESLSPSHKAINNGDTGNEASETTEIPANPYDNGEQNPSNENQAGNTTVKVLDTESQLPTIPAASQSHNKPQRMFLLISKPLHFLVSVGNNVKESLSLSRKAISNGDSGDEASKITEIAIPGNPDGNGEQNPSNGKLQDESIAKILKMKDLESLNELGGVPEITKALVTDLENGIPGDNFDLQRRHEASSRHTVTEASPPSFIQFLLRACNNYIVFLLLLSAVLSFVLGIMQEGWTAGWYEGTFLLDGVLTLVIVSAIRDYWVESSYDPEKHEPLEMEGLAVEVIRGGHPSQVSISNVVLGDVVHLKKGNQIPADGLLISGKLRVLLDDCKVSIVNVQDPFLFYGSKVVYGNGHMLVTAVGVYTVVGDMISNTTKGKKTLLHAQLDKLNTYTQVAGVLIFLLILVALIIHFKLTKEENNPGIPEVQAKPLPINELMDATKRVGKISPLTTLLTVFLAGTVEGVPFILALAITYWNRKILNTKACSRKASACVSMALVTTIVTGKTDELTLNSMEVSKCYIGEELISDDSVIHTHVLEDLLVGISMPGLPYHGPCTLEENLLRSWAKSKLGMENKTLKNSCTIVQTEGVNPNEDGQGVVVRKNGVDGTRCFHYKGPATTILDKCSFYYDRNGKKCNMGTDDKKHGFKEIIQDMEFEELTTIAFAYNQVDEQIDVPVPESDNLTLLGIVGLKKASRKDTKDAIRDCREAGVRILLISGDDVSDLENITCEYGMLMPNSDALVIHGETFRKWTDDERMEKIDKIAAIGNALPSDRQLLVKCLKENGHFVAMIGVTANETPALKEADVGIAMGNWNMARESSDIFIRDDSFRFLETIIRYGRCVYNNIQKYIQLELTMFVASLLVNFIITTSSGNSPITTIQFCWINLIMSFLGGIALLTEAPNKKLIHKKPGDKVEGIITKAMWRNILIQSLYQASIVVTFHFKGQDLLGINKMVCKTIAFNSFAICQAFNLFNAQEPDMKNVFRSIHQHVRFWVAMGFIVALQEVFMEISHVVAGNAKLHMKHWGVCFLIGALSLVVDCAAKWTSSFITEGQIQLHCMPMQTTSRTPDFLDSASDLHHSMITSSSSEPASVIEISQAEFTDTKAPRADISLLESTDTLEVSPINCDPTTISS